MDVAGQLQELHQLHKSGALTDEEFARAKQAVLGGTLGESKTVNPGMAGEAPNVVKGMGVVAEVVIAPTAGQGVFAAMPTSVPSADLTAVPDAAPAAVPLSETFSCKVQAGWSLRFSTDLILGPDRIQLGDRELLATDVEWIRLYEESLTYRGKTTLTKMMELGNPSTALKFRPQSTDFPRILSIVSQFYGPRIVRKMIDTLASGGSFNVGKLRFTSIGVEIPQNKYLILSDKPVAVPWARVECSSTLAAAQAAIRAARVGIFTGIVAIVLGSESVGLNGGGGAFVCDSASEHPLSNVGTVLGTDTGYSTCHEEKSWTPNACLVGPLVQFMREHPEISGGPWYVARDKQKVGPFPWSQLVKMASGGLLQPADMLLQEGAEKPSAAATIPGLFSGE